MDIPLNAKVRATNGKVGEVSEVITDECGAVTHFVLQESHKRSVTLPLSAVDRVEDDTVYLKLDKEEIKELPTITQTRRSAKGETNVELVARVFRDPEKDNEQSARDALKFVEELHQQHTFKILNAALLVKDKDGNVLVKDTKDIDPKKGRIMGVVTGGLIGLLAGPGGAVVGALAGLGAGGASGKLVDFGFSDKFLNKLQEYLEPGSAAVLMIVEDRWVRSVAESMADLEGFVFQQTMTDKMVEDLLAAGAEE
jgi:uncharacterized membrane protein